MQEHYWRRILPHWERMGAAYFITFRLIDTLPRPLINELKAMRRKLMQAPARAGEAEPDRKRRIKKAVFAHWDKYLDRSEHNCWLAEAGVATLVRDALYFHAGQRYELFSYVVMPNHVHVLLRPQEAASSCPQSPGPRPDADAVEFPDTATFESPTSLDPMLPGIMHSLKSFTANQANEALGRSGGFWLPGYFDHWPRSVNEFGRTMEYTEYNPVGAGLASAPEEWRWSSAHDRRLLKVEVGAALPPRAFESE